MSYTESLFEESVETVKPKMKHTAFLMLAVYTSPLFAQGGPKAPKLCSVSGQVVRTDTGEPLKSARISLLEGIPSEKRHTYRAFSDGQGRADGYFSRRTTTSEVYWARATARVFPSGDH